MALDTTPPAVTIRSYILRLWAEGPPGARVWRMSLTRIPSGERLGLANLEALDQFLREETEAQSTTRVARACD